MTAINFALRNLYGYVIWGNSLGNEKRLIYRTGFNLRGVIREIPLEDGPGPIQSTVGETVPAELPPAESRDKPDARPKANDEMAPRNKQLRLF